MSEIFPETPAAPSDGKTYGEIYWDAYRGATRKAGWTVPNPSLGEMSEAHRSAVEAGAVAVAEDVYRRGFAGAGVYPNGSAGFLGTTADLDGSAPEPAARYALVEQMGFRRTYGTVRETEFAGKPMAELTPLDGTSVRLVAPESLYQVTWLTREQAERATLTGAHAVPAIGSGRDPFGAWADDDTDPDEGKDDGMSASERDEYDRDAEFALDAADEARDLKREAEANA